MNKEACCMVISIANRKGGVGKTTTALAVISWLHKHGKKVLGIDLDAQRNLSSTMNTTEQIKYTSYDILLGKDINEAIVSTDNGDLVPGSPFLGSVEKYLQDVIGRERRLRESIEALRESYDYIVIDCPPSLGTLVVNALTASDEVLVPVQADKYSLNGVFDLYESIASIRKYTNPDIHVLGWILTRFNARTNLSKETKEVMQESSENLGTKLFSVPIRENIALKEAQAMGKSIFDYAPKSNGAIDYDNLCKEIFPYIV